MSTRLEGRTPPSTTLRTDALRQVGLFATLSDEQLGSVDARMTSVSLGPGELIFGAEQSAQDLFVLAAGEVRLSRPASGGDPAVIDTVTPGRLFGALDALGEPTYGSRAEALEPSCVLRMGQTTFRRLLLEHADIALVVLDDVAARLVRARAEAARRATDTIARRVAACLLRLADSVGTARAGVGTLIPDPLSRPELAELTGSTPEAVGRVLAGLREDGIIDSTVRWTAVLDRPRLEAVAQNREVPAAPLRVRPVLGR